jgi:hypothetical protein
MIGWSISIIPQFKVQNEGCFVCDKLNLLIYEGNVGSQLPLGSITQMTQLLLASIPKPISSSFEGEGKNSNGDSSKRRNNPARLVKNLSNLDADEWNDLIRGAVFLFGLFGYFAYFVVTRDERKKQNDKSRTGAEPK